MLPSLLDTDILSEVLKQRDNNVLQASRAYLSEWRWLTFSVLTRYEILRGLRAKGAVRQELAFDALCQLSQVLPLTEPIAVRAAAIYADLQRRGELISDADILITATALEHGLVIVTGNVAHFSRIPGLQVVNWRESSQL
ncbi:MAG: type II toxin-antitoxin system VapC family toxin [Chloroflexota bacterium]|nr:type II toxin-antitoxin system VapC family toxin [Anaerolineae bacterium]